MPAEPDALVDMVQIPSPRRQGRPVGSGRTSLRDRLYARRSVTAAGCWEYTGSRNPKGYGVISLGGRGGPNTGTHRASWTLHRGPIPAGLFVLHHCDNPPCWNPDHLFLGSAADNSADMQSKGRAAGAPGERHPRASFTEDDIREIRRLYAGGLTLRALGAQYGVSNVCIHSIVTYRTWKAVA